MKRRPAKVNHMGVVLYGPQKEECASAVHTLLNGGLPPAWEWVESSPNSVVAKRLNPSLAYFKEFLSRSPLETMKSLIRGSRCQRAIRKGEMMRQRGFLTPAVLCWGKKGNRHFMITEGLNAISLLTYIAREWVPPLVGEELKAKRELIEKFGRQIGNLHKAGVCHGDLKVSNILIRQAGNEIDFYFIDNERNEYFSGSCPRRLIEKNLVQINRALLPNLSQQDRLRFFKTYSKTYGGFASSDEKKVIKRISQKTRERRARKKERLARAEKKSL
jgi:tRNA A-37 threonylcarbamoyl transferase component Bud32